MATNSPIRLNLSRAFHNKDNLTGDVRAFGNSFLPATATVRQLYSHACSGKAFTAALFKGNSRKTDTFVSAQLIAVDFDDNVSVADVLAIPFVRQYAAIVYPTASSKNGNFKTRVVFVLSEPVEQAERWRAMAKAVCRHIGLNADDASYKPAQPFFGSDNRIEEPYLNEAAILPVELAGALTADDARKDYEAERRRAETPMIKPTGERAERYAAKALNDELDTLATALPKTRNNTLYRVAKTLFSKALGDWPGIDQSTVQRELEAIVGAWPNVRKSLGTIERARKAATPKPLELPDDDYEAAPVRTRRDDAPQSPALPEWGRAGLPDSWRTALLTYLPVAAPFVELANEAARQGLINPDDFSMAELAEAAEQLNAGFAKSTFYRLADTALEAFFPNLHTESVSLTVCKFGKNPSGRPSQHHRLAPMSAIRDYLLSCATPRLYEKHHPAEPTPDGKEPVLARVTVGMAHDMGYDGAAAKQAANELNSVFEPAFPAQDNRQDKAKFKATRDRERLERDLTDLYSTPLPAGWPIGNVSNYRAAFYRALQADNPQMSRKAIARFLGMSPRSVDSLLERAGVESIKQPLEERRLTSAHDVERQIKRMAYELQGYPLQIVSRRPGKTVEQTYSAETARAFVMDAVADGAEVIVKFQVANRQEVVREGPPEPRERRAPADEPQPVQESGPETEREETTVQAETTEKPFYGPRYNPAWLAAQFRLAMRLLGWQQPDGRLISPAGEIVAPDASADEMMALLLEQGKPAPAPDDGLGDLLAFAVDELGASVRRVEGEPYATV